MKNVLTYCFAAFSSSIRTLAISTVCPCWTSLILLANVSVVKLMQKEFVLTLNLNISSSDDRGSREIYYCYNSSKLHLVSCLVTPSLSKSPLSSLSLYPLHGFFLPLIYLILPISISLPLLYSISSPFPSQLLLYPLASFLPPSPPLSILTSSTPLHPHYYSQI